MNAGDSQNQNVNAGEPRVGSRDPLGTAPSSASAIDRAIEAQLEQNRSDQESIQRDREADQSIDQMLDTYKLQQYRGDRQALSRPKPNELKRTDDSVPDVPDQSMTDFFSHKRLMRTMQDTGLTPAFVARRMQELMSSEDDSVALQALKYNDERLLMIARMNRLLKSVDRVEVWSGAETRDNRTATKSVSTTTREESFLDDLETDQQSTEDALRDLHGQQETPEDE